jgi:capsular polysaccharide transport system permease protein
MVGFILATLHQVPDESAAPETTAGLVSLASPKGADRIFPSPVEALLFPQTLPAITPPAPEELSIHSSAFAADTDIPAEYAPVSQRAARWFNGLDAFLFLTFFVIPAALGLFYFGFYAANQYVSEFRFNVVDTSSQQSNIASGLASVLGGAGPTGAETDSYTVTDFLTSPHAVIEAEKRLPIRSIYSPVGADWLFRLNAKATQEQLNRYWRWMVSSYYDPVTGIGSAQIRAFSAYDAHAVAAALLASAEELVNDMQRRRYADSIKFAEEALNRDNEALGRIRKEMLSLRLSSGYVEPGASGVAENTTLSTDLRTFIVTEQAERDALERQIHNANAPVVEALNQRITAAQQQLATLEKEIQANGSNSGKLATVAGEFDELNARQLAATTEMTSDLTTLQQARAQADAQHIYLSTYVYPTLPTSSTFPNRSLGMFLSLLLTFGMFCFAKLVTAAIRSHSV